MPEDFEKILPLILALLLIFIFPVLLRRRGMDYGDLGRMLFGQGRKQDPDTIASPATVRKNSGRHALTEFVSQLLAFSKRHKTGLVFPGTVVYGDEKASLLAIVVTKSRAIGVNCYGFTGTIRDTGGQDEWKQVSGGQTVPVPNPLAANKTQDRIVRQAFHENGLSAVPYRTIAVFTSAQADLMTKHPDDVMTKAAFIAFLKELAATEPEQMDSAEISRRIHALVKKD
ncbi:MAG: NERD domain-containing protein [Lachnospiraceae bacterium]|nr:NERD domain-containing protein [Lachnospiraceae bacterium]